MNKIFIRAPVGSHQLAELNELKNEKLKEAFGIRENYTEGSSFSAEYQVAKKEMEKMEREAKWYVLCFFCFVIIFFEVSCIVIFLSILMFLFAFANTVV